jgi:hypothetical protein
VRHLYAVFVAVIHIKIVVEFANYKIIILNSILVYKKGALHESLFCSDTTLRYIKENEELIYTVTAVKKLTKRYKR